MAREADLLEQFCGLDFRNPLNRYTFDSYLYPQNMD